MHENLLHLMDICTKYPYMKHSLEHGPYRIYTELFMYNEECFWLYIYQTKEWIMSCHFKEEPHAISIYGNEEGYEVSSLYYDQNPEGATFSQFVFKEDIGKYLDDLFKAYADKFYSTTN